MAAVFGFSALSVHAQQAAAQQEEPAAQAALPTTGDGAAVVKLLSGVCKPIVEGRGSFDQLATSAGMTKDKAVENQYVMPLSQRPFQITIRKPSNQNLTTCEMNVVIAPGWDGPVIEALNTWRFLHEPQLHLQRNQISTYNDAKTRRTLTWDNWENQGDDGIMVGLAFNKLDNANGTQIVRGADSILVQYSQRTPLPELIAAAKQRKIDEAKAKADYEKAKADYDRQMAEYQAAVKAAEEARAAQEAQQKAAAAAAAAPDPLAAQYQAALQAQGGAAAAPK
jgi:hypothetical protein